MHENSSYCGCANAYLRLLKTGAAFKDSKRENNIYF